MTTRTGIVRRALALALLMGALAPVAGATEKIALATRLVTVFTRVEAELDRAVAAHDNAAIDAMVSPDFEARSALDPTDPTARADWLGAEAAGTVEQMTVHEHGTLAIASFVRTVPDAAGAARSYVIDVWERRGEGWLLLTRYASPLPAEDADEAESPPTGKG
jgi:hypothetical protein